MDRPTMNDKIKEMETEYDKDSLEYITKKSKWIFIVWAILNMLYCGAIIMLGYNWIIPNITKLQPINYPQALLLDWFVTFMFDFNYMNFDYKESSFIGNIARQGYRTFYYTLVLLIMFIIHLFI